MKFSNIVIVCMIIGIFLLYSRIMTIGGKAHRSLHYTRLSGIDLVVLSNTTLTFFRNSLEKQGGYTFTQYPTNADLIFFNLLTDYADMYDAVNAISKCSIIYGIVSIDKFASKSDMFRHLRKVLPSTILHKVVPKTYLLTDEDMPLLRKEYDPSKLYILKKNIQRQQGVLITRSIDTILSAEKDSYVVCQELITNNFLVRGRKINLRKYIVLVVGKEPKVYMYNNGFIYYAKDLFDPMSSAPDVHITTGYVDRKIYEENPLTIRELYKEMGKQGEILRTNVEGTLRLIFRTYMPVLKERDGLNTKTNFVILGCDLSVDRTLKVKLMEINKGPDMSAKDARDGSLKQDLVSQSLRLVGAIPGSPKNITRII